MNISSTDFQNAFQTFRQECLDSGIGENQLDDFDLAIRCLTRERLIAEFCCALWESGLSEQADSEQLMTAHVHTHWPRTKSHQSAKRFDGHTHEGNTWISRPFLWWHGSFLRSRWPIARCVELRYVSLGINPLHWVPLRGILKIE